MSDKHKNLSPHSGRLQANHTQPNNPANPSGQRPITGEKSVTPLPSQTQVCGFRTEGLSTLATFCTHPEPSLPTFHRYLDAFCSTAHTIAHTDHG